MKTLRRAVAAPLFLLAAQLPAFAISLYDGVLTRGETPTLAPVVPSLTPTELPSINNRLPGELSLPDIPRLELPEQAQSQQTARISETASPEQRQQQLSANASLERLTQVSQQRAEARQASAGAENVAGSVFDGAFVEHGRREYFGELAPGEEAGVVVSKRAPASSPEAAPGETEMNDNVKLSPKTNREREDAAAALFARGGAAYDPNAPATAKVDLTRYDTVQFQDAGRGKRNVVVVKKGRTDRIVVVGSHNDKVENSGGVIDNWTGTTMVAHLYQTVKDQPTEATIVFIAHAREEEGLIGSRKFVSSLSREELKRVESNINLDTLAIKGGGTLVWDNGDGWASAKAMLDAAERAVAEENARRSASDRLTLKREPLNGGDADSSSYRDAGVPWYATFFGGSEELIFSIIHSPRDNFGAFSLPIYKETYFVTLAILKYLDLHGIPAGA